ncbi:SMC-Scp complex subunit ScpB [Legionella spiritensis]|uniref:Segregation and condensation protein B n=1 Tax=Legionella spiritensis TaxID=452 RepID=A0A0W0Z587_LEGSP|nr:SMC-Scp complex subunit ScpB [Legionella spiritensis]KTD63999.1 segregation and condensation protein B [Legionella spiritensis]SNV37084.1 segregation and condensation protein B [Legionella spiritensis]
MNDQEIKGILEALLMSSAQPLTIEQMLSVFHEEENPGPLRLRELLDRLARDYDGHAIELVEVASGYLLQTRLKYSSWIIRLQAEKPARYSRALLETLAIIAYKQPVTRADIEDIRGVSVSSSILKTLQEREWIRVAGHRDVPGKPAVYVTTRMFLDYFNLTSLNQLPPIENQPEISGSNSEARVEECV